MRNKRRRRRRAPRVHRADDTKPPWGEGHEAITAAALAACPGRLAERLAGAREALIREYCHIPDRCFPGQPALRRYLAFHRDGLPLHYLPDSDTVEDNYHRVYPAFRFYLAHAVAALEADEPDEAARYLGSLFHFLQDAASPQHGLDSPRGFKEPGGCSPWPKLLQLFPPPPGREHEHPAMVAERRFARALAPPPGALRLGDYRPWLLGTGAAEAAFHLYQRYWQILALTRASVPDLIAAVYARNQAKVSGIARRLMSVSGGVCADALYTALACAAGVFPRRQVRGLERVRLEALVPLVRPWYSPTAAYGHQCIVRNANLDARLRRHPLALLAPRGGRRVVRYRHGLGTGMGWKEPEESTWANPCDYVLRYELPPGVFRRFEVTFGLNPRLPHGGRVRLEVRFNNRTRARTPVLSAPAPGRAARFPVAAGGTLELVALNAEPVDRNRLRFPQVHIVWADPVLTRAER